MATFKGPVQFDGSLGNLRSYWDKDLRKQIVSTKRGKNPKYYKKRSSAKRVIELNKEFIAVNIWTKLIRRGTENLLYLKNGRINGMLVRIGKRIQVMNATDIKGQRRIESSKFNSLLVGFSMNNAHPFKDVCYLEPGISITEDRREVTLRLANFISDKKLKWTEPIQNYRVYLNIFELPDVEWDKEHRRFWPVYDNASLCNQTTVSDWFSVSPDPIDFQIAASFGEKYQPKEKATVVVSLGFEFASGIQYNTPYVVKDHGTMAIVGCF